MSWIIDKFTNPVADGCDQQINMATNVVLPKKIQDNTNNRIDIGEERFVQIVSEKIVTTNVNLWAPMEKLKLQMRSSAAKKHEHRIVKLNEYIAIFERMPVFSNTRYIDLKQVVETYE